MSDLLEDLAGADSRDVRTVVTSLLWQEAAELLLSGERHWIGTGKGLLREVGACDIAHGTDHASVLSAGVRAAANGKIAVLTDEVDSILAPYGGRLFAGFHLAGKDPAS